MSKPDRSAAQWTERGSADTPLAADPASMFRSLCEANARLKEEIAERQRREAVQRATYQISEAVHTADDLAAFYARVHEIVGSLMPARNFYVALLEAKTQTISFAYFVDEQADEWPGDRPLGTGLTGVVIRVGKALLVKREDTEAARRNGDSLFIDGRAIPYVEAGVPAAVWLGAPLVSDGRVFGVMAVQDYRDGSAYGEEDRRLLAFVAEQTALAVSRKRSAQALRDSEEQHRALFEATRQGVMLHDDRAFFSVNPAALRILGYPNEEGVIGKHPSELAAPRQPGGEDSREAAQRHIGKCLRDGSTRFEWLTRRADGSEVLIDVLLTAIDLGGRRIIQAVIDDITERKRAEGELLRALAREQELGQLRSNFVSMVSHEFRTPLAIIQSSAEILDEYLDRLTPEQRREHLVSVQSNTRRMASLMEEVLLIGRLDAGKMECKPRALDLAAFARLLVDEVLSATDRRCSIRLSVGEVADEAVGDERLLRHILTNLLTNAVKYSDAGSEVELEVNRDGVDAVFAVRDRGIGIPEADREWLFSAFHRGRNVGDRPGTGLGLTIVKRCVDLHGGRIRVESAPGQGTVATVRIPVFG